MWTYLLLPILQVCGVQSISGTGALRLSAEFLRCHLPEYQTVLISDPTWG